MMASTLIRLASRSFRVDAAPSRISSIRQYYASHARESHAGQTADIVFRWDDESIDVPDVAARYPAGTDRQGMLLLQLLIMDHLTRMEPGLLPLHGNVLLIEGEKDQPPRALALVGASQSGKTSQTLALMEAIGARARLHAEDVILLDADKGIIWPFARAATVRTGLANEECLQPPSRHTDQPIPLPILGDWFHLQAGSASKNSRNLLAVSHLTPRTASSLGQLASITEDKAGFTLLHFPTPPVEEEWAGWLEMLESEGILVLWAGRDDLIGNRQEFPSEPALQRVPYSAAHPSFVRSLVRPRRQTPAQSGARLFQLACAVGLAEHWDLQPGGTPTRTARLILDSLGIAT